MCYSGLSLRISNVVDCALSDFGILEEIMRFRNWKEDGAKDGHGQEEVTANIKKHKAPFQKNTIPVKEATQGTQ